MVLKMMNLGGRGRCFLVTLTYLGIAFMSASLIMYMRMFIVSPSIIVIISNASTSCQITHDTRVLTKQALETHVGSLLPSLPVAYWQPEKHFWKNNVTCPKFPSIDDIVFENTYWQTLQTSNRKFYLYGAYLDTRNTLNGRPAVRILGAHDNKDVKVVTYCQLWFQEHEKPVIVKNHDYSSIWLKRFDVPHKNFFRPYLTSCELPKRVRELVPLSVSLVENSCDHATNNLRVRYDHPSSKKKNFAVCVKGLDYPYTDISARLVEWLEFVQMLGADKIFFYKVQVHPNLSKVLDYYSALGLVTVTPFTLPSSQVLNLPGLQELYIKKGKYVEHQMETIPYNDCLYRNLYKYRWVVLLDIDEMIVPVQDYTWGTVMQRALAQSKSKPNNTSPSSYATYHTYFLEENTQDLQIDMPNHMYMLKNIYRLKNHTDPTCCTKAFHDVDRVLTLDKHFPIECLGGNCSAIWIAQTHAILHRYRKGREESRPQVKRDTLVWRWRKPLVKRASGVLRSLNLI